MTRVTSQRIGAGTLFKVLLVGGVFTHVLLVMLVMIGVLLGLFTPTEGDAPMSLWQAELLLLGYLVVGGVVFVPFWAGVFWLGTFPGVWLYSKFRPMVLFYKPVGAGEPKS